MSARPAILVTGAARRIGAALARHFAQSGYDIALHYRRSEAEARQVQNEVEALGAKCVLFAQDLSDAKAIPALMAKVQDAMPGCVSLVNNASIFERASFMETDEALFDRQFAVNFKAPFFLTQAFAQAFGKGCVVNLLDTDIVQTQGSHFAYLQSKKALADFTQMAARQLGPDIRVNGVCPGIMLPSNELDQHYMDKLAGQLPLGRLGTLQQVADAALWLCRSEAVTGQLIFTDGGQHLL